MNKRIIAVISTAVLLLIAVVVGIALAWNRNNDYSSVIHANWGFGLPSEAHYSEVYYKDSGASFHGDGIRFHVFSYKEEKPVEEMLAWSGKEEETIFSSSYREAVTEWLNSIDVPNEKYPDYSKCLYWYGSQNDNSEIIVLWDKSSMMIYVVESFL